MIEHEDYVSAEDRARMAVLDAVSRCPLLWENYVLKGGLALRYVYGSPRKSYDLDFTSVRVFARGMTPATEELLQAFSELLNASLREVAPGYGFAGLRVHWQRLSDELPILYARVGYAQEAGYLSPDTYVEMQVTLSEQVGIAVEAEVNGIRLHVPALEDILAEKLKALLQQVSRGVHRASDLYDLWYYISAADRKIDPDLVRRCLLTKTAESVDLGRVTTAQFRAPEVLEHASQGYEEIGAHLLDGTELPPPGEAYQAVLCFVDLLGLPDE